MSAGVVLKQFYVWEMLRQGKHAALTNAVRRRKQRRPFQFAHPLGRFLKTNIRDQVLPAVFPQL
jgi:hypothetical protein